MNGSRGEDMEYGPPSPTPPPKNHKWLHVPLKYWYIPLIASRGRIIRLSVKYVKKYGQDPLTKLSGSAHEVRHTQGAEVTGQLQMNGK